MTRIGIDDQQQVRNGFLFVTPELLKERAAHVPPADLPFPEPARKEGADGF